VAARGLPRLGRLAALALALGVAQLAAGVANVLLSIPVEVTGLHSLLAALLVLATTASFHEAFRNRLAA
jgi:heme A synthase